MQQNKSAVAVSHSDRVVVNIVATATNAAATAANTATAAHANANIVATAAATAVRTHGEEPAAPSASAAHGSGVPLSSSFVVCHAARQSVLVQDVAADAQGQHLVREGRKE
jgi:hypothetical protein